MYPAFQTSTLTMDPRPWLIFSANFCIMVKLIDFKYISLKPFFSNFFLSKLFFQTFKVSNFTFLELNVFLTYSLYNLISLDLITESLKYHIFHLPLFSYFLNLSLELRTSYFSSLKSFELVHQPREALTILWPELSG